MTSGIRRLLPDVNWGRGATGIAAAVGGLEAYICLCQWDSVSKLAATNEVRLVPSVRTWV